MQLETGPDLNKGQPRYMSIDRHKVPPQNHIIVLLLLMFWIEYSRLNTEVATVPTRDSLPLW